MLKALDENFMTNRLTLFEHFNKVAEPNVKEKRASSVEKIILIFTLFFPFYYLQTPTESLSIYFITYLPTIVRHPKWRMRCRNIKVGDLV